MDKENNPKVFTCDAQGCSYTSIKKYNFQRHLRDVHDRSDKEVDQLNDALISCHLCPCKVTSRKKLIDHLKVEHILPINIVEDHRDSKEGN